MFFFQYNQNIHIYFVCEHLLENIEVLKNNKNTKVLRIYSVILFIFVHNLSHLSKTNLSLSRRWRNLEYEISDKFYRDKEGI